ncbi:MAG: hypothetical protein JF612_07755 [Planctomycetia bacterium]|jgi:hypothetical protein|nr:hypothetical protein [Planctomycetia bacterium]
MADYDPNGGIIAVSCPGGMARQFRVQVESGETPAGWKQVGSFRDSRQAGECAARHQKAGQKTRVVACRALPTAA